MRLNINLASQPYEDPRRFAVRWGSLVGVLALVTLTLGGMVVSNYVSARGVTRETAKLHARMTELNHEQASAEAILNRPENRETRDRSRFLNTLIARKAFSWTQVFADLEKIMPARVHVISIRPDLGANNQLQIHLQAVGDSRDKANELVRRLEQSPVFRSAWVVEEKDEPSGPNSGAQFEIVAQYVPQLLKATGERARAQKGGQ